MKIRLVKDVGFCWGVRRALDLAIRSSASGRKIYTSGPLIHNKKVVQLLKAKGIKTLSYKIDNQRKKSSVIIRAHGVSPIVEEHLLSQGYRIINGTCPHVMKSQKMVREYANNGYQIIIAGDKKHAEVISLMGYAQANKYHSRALVISSSNEVNGLIQSKAFLNNKKICLLAQSTFQPQLYQEIVDALLRNAPRDKKIVILNTICRAPAKRQQGVKELAKKVDAFVVIGDHNSANTTNLTLLANSLKIPAFQVASVSELPLKQLKRYSSIGIATGTSTPDSVIQDVIEKLSKL